MLTRRRLGVLTILMFALTTASWVAMVGVNAAADEILAAGEKAPDFTLKTADDRALTLSELARDKTVLVNFYFLDNAFSRQEHAELQKLYAKHKDRGLEIVAVNGGKRDTSELIKKRWDEMKLTFLTVKDDSPERTALKAFRVYAFPTSYFIKDGKIVSAWIGFDPQKGTDRLREEFAKAGFR
jgi:peroxiredoxin